MTDKFVVSTNEIGEIIVTDVETDRVYRYDAPSNFFGLIRLLNEQQATIEEQNKEIEEWEFSFRTEMAHHRVAEKELQEKIREQQATIRRLQDLCGKSDGENAKLRIENEQLKNKLNGSI